MRARARNELGQLALFLGQGFRSVAVHSFSLVRNLSIA